MAIHSEKLEETTLWKTYCTKVPPNNDRSKWVQDVFDNATEYLKDIRRTFGNYTLHDQTHVLNVIDAMGGLLGDQVDKLSIGELELLILAASMHDLGMVYTAAEIEQHYNSDQECRRFLQKYSPNLLGCPANEWPEDTRQFFLRQLHPFRLPEILHSPRWRNLFDKRPQDIVSERCIIAVCQAHGEEGRALKSNPNLDYLDASVVDPRFCALLLRICDLLDFDDTRAPKILYDYVTNNKKSREEWDKHQASAGFTYRATPSTDPLPYKADCHSPGIEHTVREFLNWVDEELNICSEQKRFCRPEWQQNFPFPMVISRKEIESKGYKSGDFKMTMDQEQILNVLSGENLYNNNAIFVRELLQNSIDATMLRSKLDRSFSPKDARIDFWEWTDQEGNTWFRIDDRGTGMTEGMLQRYFLKVGNSYYTSKELTRDLRMHGLDTAYQGISRFGIGFLSCFLCGEYAEVSTLYFDADKSRQESTQPDSLYPAQYGLRMEITGLSGYYTLKSQEEHHIVDAPLPAPPYAEASILSELESAGYRSKPGTSIVVRLNPKKLGSIDLRKEAESHLCVSRIPVYYNGKQIGRTYQEFMDDMHKLAGETLYEFSDRIKAEFDAHFPALSGQYPKISMTVVPLDTPEGSILPGLSGAIVKYDLLFEEKNHWKIKDQSYELNYRFGDRSDGFSLSLYPNNIKGSHTHWYNGHSHWHSLTRTYDSQALDDLARVFEELPACPQSAEQIGDAWLPFEGEDPADIWRLWIDQHQERLQVDLSECGVPNITKLSGHNKFCDVAYVYNGVLHGTFYTDYSNRSVSLFLLEDDLRPKVNIARSQVVAIPLQAIIAEAALLYSCDLLADDHFDKIDGWTDAPLSMWRQICTPALRSRVHELSNEFFNHIKNELQEGKTLYKREYSFTISRKYSFQTCQDVLATYFTAYLQDTYSMTVSYDDTHLQVVSFSAKDTPHDSSRYDLFPPMLFCMADDDKSRQYLCCADSDFRFAITEDHPYAVWLLDHATVLNQYFPRHFQQIIFCLRDADAEVIIESCNEVHKQLHLLAQRQAVDIGQIPSLSTADFWKADWMIKEEKSNG